MSAILPVPPATLLNYHIKCISVYRKGPPKCVVSLFGSCAGCNLAGVRSVKTAELESRREIVTRQSIHCNLIATAPIIDAGGCSSALLLVFWGSESLVILLIWKTYSCSGRGDIVSGIRARKQSFASHHPLTRKRPRNSDPQQPYNPIRLLHPS